MSDTNTVEAIYEIKDQMSAKIDRITAKMNGLTERAHSVTAGIGSIAKGAGVFSLVNTGVQALTNNLQGAVKRFDQLTNFPKVMQSMGASTKESTASINKMSDAIDGLPTSLNDIAMNTQRLFPVLGNNLNKATNSSIALNDAFLSSGASAADASRGLTQYVQMLSSGKVDMQSWKSLEETMPYAMQKVSKSFGIASGSSQELYKKLQSGEITMQQLNDRFIKLDGGVNGFAKVARTATGGIGTSFINLGNRITKGLADIIQAFDELSVKTTGASIAAHISDLGNLFKNVLGDIAKWVGGLADRIKPYIDVIKESFKSIGPPVSAAINAVKTSLSILNNQTDSSTKSLNTFKSIMASVTNVINIASQFVQKHADAIASLIQHLPQLIAGYIAVTRVFPVLTSGFKSISKGILDGVSKFNAFKSVVSSLNGAVSSAMAKSISSIRNFISVAGQISGKFSEISGAASKLKSQGMGTFDAWNKSMMAFVPESRNIGSSLSFIEQRIASFKGKTKNVFTGLLDGIKGIPAKFSSVGVALETLGGVFTAFKTTAISAITSVNTAMLTNPVTGILLVIGLAVAAVAVAWQKNFGHIREYTAGVFEALGHSLGSIGNMFAPLMEKGSAFGGIMRTLGTVLKDIAGNALKGLGLALGVVVDTFRLAVAAVAIVLEALNGLAGAVIHVGMALFDLATGHPFKAFDEGKKAVKSATDSVKDMGKTIGDFGKDSATMGVWNSFDKTDKKIKESDKDAKKLDQSFKDLAASGNSAGKSLQDSFQKADQTMESAFSSDRMQKFSKSSSEIMDRFVKTNQDAYNKLDSASKASGTKRIALTNEAMSGILDAENKGAAGVLAVMKDNSEMLKENKDQEGQALTQEQRDALEQQNKVIRDGLMKQEELYVKAAQTKIEAGQKLSSTEEKAVISNVDGLYRHESEQIKANESQIAQLKQQEQQATTASEKENIKEQIATLDAGNKTLLEKQTKSGVQMLQLLKQQGDLNGKTIADSLKSMGATTDKQLNSILQSYKKNGASVDDQLKLLAGIMQLRGVNANNALVKALQSGNLASITKMKVSEAVEGLSALPAEMFKGGSKGKDNLINGLKDGSINVKNIGKYLSDLASQGLGSDDGGKANKSGKKKGDDHSKGLSSTKKENEKAGQDVKDAAAKGMGSRGSFDPVKTGKKTGDDYANGVKKSKDNVKSASKSLNTTANSALSSGSSQAKSSGTKVGSGFASGISTAKSRVTSAAKQLTSAASATLAKVSGMTASGAKAGNGFASGISSKVGAVRTAGNALITAVVAVTSKIERITTAGQKNGTAFANGIKSKADDAEKSGEKIASSGVKGSRSKHQDFYDVGKYLGEGLAQGMNDSLPDVTKAADKLVEQADRAVRAKGKINSPSKVFAELGGYISQGFAKGINQQAYLATNAVNGMMDNITHQATQSRMGMDFSSNSSLEISTSSNIMQGINEIVSAIRDGHVIVLDSDAVVGHTKDGMDSALGETSYMKARRGGF